MHRAARLVVALAACVALAPSALAQPDLDDQPSFDAIELLGPPLSIPSEPGVVNWTFPDTAGPVGGTATTRVFAETIEPFHTFHYFFDFDPALVTSSEPQIAPGPGLQSYIATHGEPPCDIVVFPSRLYVAIHFVGPPYSSDTWGTEFLGIEWDLLSTTPGSTPVEFKRLDDDEELIATSTITFVPATDVPVRTGDVNSDQSCNLADVLDLVRSLFLANAPEVACKDAADVNDNGQLEIADAIGVLNMIVGLNAPIDACRYDATPDTLGCGTSSCP